MTDKTKRIVLIAVCCLLCVAAAVGIAVRFGGNADISSGVVSDDPTQSGDPSVDIDNNGQTDLDVQVETPDASETDPAQGADSSGLEQTIQADPVSRNPPKKRKHPPTPPRCRMITTERMCRRRSARPRMRRRPPMRKLPQ